MSTDPQRSRESAVRCAERATTTRSPRLKAQLVELSRNYLRSSIELERSLLLWTGILRSHRESMLFARGLGELRDQLVDANRHVAKAEWLVAGWRNLVDRVQAEGKDVTTARELLETLQTDLETAVSLSERAEKAL